MRPSFVMTLLAATVASSAIAAPTDSKFESYTRAYEQAGAESQPMLVILNPGQDSADRLDISALASDADLSGYVVAEIDTTTAHGEEVHKLFKSPELPHVVVIDEQQKKQIFKTSRSLSADELSDVLARYRKGAVTVTAAKPVTTTSSPITASSLSAGSTSSTRVISGPVVMPRTIYSAPPANCPSCQRNARYRF